MNYTSNLTATQEIQAALSPQEITQILKDGNKRFVTNQTVERNHLEQVEKTGSGQYPLAVVLGCIDSRVPAETAFDLGIGDIFNVRVAGNFVNTDILGSMEFACKVAGAKVILVLGHTHCGAIKGACDNVELGNLTTMLSKLKPAVESVKDETSDRSSSNPRFVQKVADSNVAITIQNIREKSPVLEELISSGEVEIVGAMYDVESGKVSFFE